MFYRDSGWRRKRVFFSFFAGGGRGDVSTGGEEDVGWWRQSKVRRLYRWELQF